MKKLVFIAAIFSFSFVSLAQEGGKVKKADGTYKDKCVPIGEAYETEMALAILKLFEGKK